MNTKPLLKSHGFRSVNKRILFTQEGYDALVKEKESLELSRPDAVADLAKARAMGDLSENGYYKSARAKLSFVDSRIRHLKHLIQFAQIKQVIHTGVVDVGSTVTLFSNNITITYALVGGYESNPTEGKISHHSPLGKALLGKKEKEIAIVSTPKGDVSYTIMKIS